MKIRKNAAGFFRFFKEVVARLTFNFKTLILFVAIYSLISWIIVTVATYLLTQLAMKAAGLYYLANDNFLRYLRSPVSWLTFAGCLIVFGYIQMIEIGAMIRIFYASGEKRKISLGEAFYFGVDSANQTLKPVNWSIFLFMILMFPYLGLFSISNISFSVAVPGFLQEYLLTHRIWTIIYIASLILVFVFTVRWMMSLHIFVLERKTFPEAKRRSIDLEKHRYIEAVLMAAGAAVLWIALFYAAGIIADLLTIAGARAIYGADNTGMISYSRNIAGMVINIVNMLLTPSFCIAFLSVQFGRFNGHAHEKVVPVAYQKTDIIFSRKSVAAFVCVFAGCCTIYASLFFTGRAMHNTDIHRPEIVAHKGDSIRAPENTIPAFESAIKEGLSDWIELDVRQCADGTVVVCHDDKLKRITGVNVSIHDMTYGEIAQLDAGAWFDEKYAGTKICTLSEAMDLCKGKIRMQIELKPTKYDSGLEAQVVQLIHEKGMEDECVVTSLSAASLLRVREADPEIILVYSLAAANGNIADIPFADWFTIEESNVTEELVGRIHAKDKRVYVWTVNDEEDVQRLIDCGVDGILTDDPIMMDYTLGQADYTGGFAKMLRSFTDTPNFMLQFGF